MENSNVNSMECCPEFNPEPWHNVIVEWKNKLFIKDKVCTLFYIPLNFGKVMVRLDKKTRQAGAKIPDYLCLSEHTSMWNMNLYLAVDKEISQAENITISGKFFSKAYEGNFNETGKWTKDFDKTLKEKSLSLKKMYMWYTTCPKCAKKWGKNYVVIFGEIAN